MASPVLDRVKTNVLVQDEWLRVTGAPGEGDALCVVFQSMTGRRRKPGTEEFQRYARAGGARHALFVTDMKSTWCNAPDYFERVAEAVHGYVSENGIKRVVLMGLSMGGFAALGASRDCPADVVIALAPQYSVSREIIPGERRFPRMVEQVPIRIPLINDMISKNAAHFVFHGIEDEDIAHMRGFAAVPEICQVVFPLLPHPLVTYLDTKSLVAFLGACEDVNYRRLARLAARHGAMIRTPGPAGHKPADPLVIPG